MKALMEGLEHSKCLRSPYVYHSDLLRSPWGKLYRRHCCAHSKRAAAEETHRVSEPAFSADIVHDVWPGGSSAMGRLSAIPFQDYGSAGFWVEHPHVRRCWAKGSAGGPLLVWHLRDACATQAGNLCCASGTPSAPGLGRHWAFWRLLGGFPQRWSGWVVGGCWGWAPAAFCHHCQQEVQQQQPRPSARRPRKNGICSQK